jgi:phosphocarrier protein FPr
VVGIVIVSHSAGLADGVVELARQMGGEELALEAAGGMEDGEIGTDAERVKAAIERARSDDGVLVLMDLGSAVMSAEMAAEMVAMEDAEVRVVLSEAPLVEGAVAAAARARGGSTLDEVAAEARAALGMKASALGAEEAEREAQAPAVKESGPHRRLHVGNRLGLHARPAARFVEAASRFDAAVTVSDETTGRGPVDGRSLTALVTLGVRRDHEILVRASGEGAEAALDALEALAAHGFGDEDGGAAPAPAAGAEAPAAGEPEPEAPSPGAELAGIAASSGVAVGPARPLDAPVLAPVDDEPAGDPAEEWARLQAAREEARADIERARAAVAGRAGESEAAIFDAHVLLLDDAALLDPARRAIEDGQAGAASAWAAAAAAAAGAYRDLDDPYLRERAADVEDVAARVLRHLRPAGSAGGAAPIGPAGTAGPTGAAGQAGPAGPEDAGIVLADELTPGQAAELDPALVRGIATARGGATAHAAILARALGIPAVVGLGRTLLAVAEGTPLVLDGDAGTVRVDPGEAAVAEAEQRRAAGERRRARARAAAHEPAVTRDGTRIEVAANLGSPAEVAGALEQGAEGVGLLRTEFLFLDRDAPPGEDEQVAVYSEIARSLGDRPLVVRTLDAGADKPLPFLRQAAEDNPFLGRRGIRLALARPELLDTQLRALVRASAEHPLKVMFPMVATLGELRAAREALERAQARTGARAQLEVGVMVEVPAVALSAERFAPEVDFFSIGTNDLSQYTMAAERGNPDVAALIDGPLPPVLRLVALVTRAAAGTGAWVGVCGELAGEPAAAALLAGLGVRELSMAAPRIPEVKEVIRGLDLGSARATAERALELDDATAVRALAADLLAGQTG